jgi:hypothetical protein
VSGARTTRTRILALFPPLAGVLLLVGEALTPRGLDMPLQLPLTAALTVLGIRIWRTTTPRDPEPQTS